MLLDLEQEGRKRQNNDVNFPRMLYRFPGSGPDAVALQDGKYGVAVALDQDAADLLLDDGYSLTAADARAAAASKDAAVKRAAADAAHQKAIDDAKALLASAGPTRDELETKATELGIKFNGRTPDKKLGEQIAAALRH